MTVAANALKSGQKVIWIGQSAGVETNSFIALVTLSF
jgi:hypothetical protein